MEKKIFEKKILEKIFGKKKFLEKKFLEIKFLEIKFFGKYHKINAEIFKINAFSGHADQNELLDWLSHFNPSPKLTFINHGEPHQSQALKTKIKTDLQWKCTIAKPNNVYHLD